MGLFEVRVEALADGVNLSDVIMRKAHVVGVAAARLDLRRADLRRARVEGCTFTDALMGELRFDRARIARTTFVRCDLTDAELTRVTFDDVRFESCVLAGVRLDGAVRVGPLVLPGFDLPSQVP